MRMLCDNTKSFRPLNHYGSTRKARIDRIISEKFHAPAINAASSELLEEKTNKSDAEFQEWDVTRSYVYILGRMSSFVNASNQARGHNHNDATPTYWETRVNPAELVNQNNQEHEEVEYNEFGLEDYNEEETMDTNEGEGQRGNPMDEIMNLLRENLNCHPQPRQRVSKVKKRKRARRGVRKPRRQSDKQKFPIRTERGVVSQPAVGTRFATTVAGGNSFSEPDIILATAPTQLGRDSRLREFGVVLKMDWLSSNGAQIDYKGKKVKIRMPNGKEIVIKGQRQTQKFLNIAQAKKLLRKDSKAYLAYVAGTKREAPIIPMRKNNHTYGSRNFLGINQFYERFVRDFAKISGPLIRPTCKTEKVVWNEKCEESFQELKRSLVSALVLALPDGKGDFVIYSDASHKGL
ncbi:hypothetical protein AgCh_028830 [Apium graveolens]